MRGERNSAYSPERRRFLKLGLKAVAGYALGSAITEGLPRVANALEGALWSTRAQKNNLPKSENQEQPKDPVQEEEVKNRIAPAFTKSVQYWNESIQRWSLLAGLDPDLVALTMQIESCGIPDAISKTGARGLFQVMPFNFPKEIQNSPEKMLNAETNAQVATGMLAKLLKKTNGDVRLALAAYNGGNIVLNNPNNPEKWSRETQRYYEWSQIYEEVKRTPEESQTLQDWIAYGGASLCRQAEERLGLR